MKKENKSNSEIIRNKNFSKNKKRYFGYYKRVVLFALIFIILFSISAFSLYKAFEINEEKAIEYKDNSNLDYKVYLKKNDFYEKEYLDKNMSYIASLIDHINIDFNYRFDIGVKTEMNFTYDIIGKLVIADSTGNNIFFEKDYTLLEQKQASNNENLYNLKESISINYNEYNDLANRFKLSYGVDTNSSLRIYFRINKKNTKDTDKFAINENNEMSIIIPLSEKAVNIKLDYQEINSSKRVISKSSISIGNVFLIVVAILTFIVSVAALLRLLELLFASRLKMSKYDKYISKLLREYDRLIVESSFCPDFEKYTIMEVKSFKELLDVRDNLKLPIMYYNVSPNQKCYFYIQQDNNLYLVTIKAVDLNEK